MAERATEPLANRAADVAGALAAALLVFTAVPAVLVFAVGNPLSGGVGHDWSPLARDALCVLTLAAWIAWAACCAQLLRSVVDRVRRGEAGTRPSSLADWLAGRIALGVLAVTSVGAPVAVSSGAGAVAPEVHAPLHRSSGVRPTTVRRRVASGDERHVCGAPGRQSLEHRRGSNSATAPSGPLLLRSTVRVGCRRRSDSSIPTTSARVGGSDFPATPSGHRPTTRSGRTQSPTVVPTICPNSSYSALAR